MSSHADRRSTGGNLWSGTPGAYKVGALLGIIGWFVVISGYSTSTVNGRMTGCRYVDYAKIGIGIIVVLLAVAGYLSHRRSRRSIPEWAAIGIAVLLLADGVLLLIDGLDVINRVCH